MKNSHLNSFLQPQHESSENLTMVSVTFRQQIISAKPLQSFAQNEEDSADWWAAATQVGGKREHSILVLFVDKQDLRDRGGSL